MAKTTYRKGTTAVGTFNFPHLLDTEQFQGKDTGRFAVSFAPDDDKERQRLLAEIDEEWQKYKESDEGKKHKYKYDYANGTTTYKDEEYFKYKMTRSINTRNRGEWVRRVPIFDAAGHEIGAELKSIGSGTRGRVAYELVPFYMNDKNYGISLRLTGVQIIDLKESGTASASSLGFGQEEGYTFSPQEDSDTTIDVSGIGDEEEF